MKNSRMVVEMQQLEKKVSQLEHENELLKTENENIKKIVHGERQLNFDSPLDFAKSLIEHRTHIEERAIENAKGAVLVLVPEHDKVTFDYNQLEEIAEYLLTYCKHNKED